MKLFGYFFLVVAVGLFVSAMRMPGFTFRFMRSAFEIYGLCTLIVGLFFLVRAYEK